METTKNILQSKTVWCALAALIASLVSVALRLDTDTANGLAEAAPSAVGAIFAVLTIVGRIVASQKLTVSATPKSAASGGFPTTTTKG